MIHKLIDYIRYNPVDIQLMWLVIFITIATYLYYFCKSLTDSSATNNFINKL
jgi:membrane-bound acyltransferase YfiQ involved in biofilm formation